MQYFQLERHQKTFGDRAAGERLSFQDSLAVKTRRVRERRKGWEERIGGIRKGQGEEKERRGRREGKGEGGVVVRLFS